MNFDFSKMESIHKKDQKFVHCSCWFIYEEEAYHEWICPACWENYKEWKWMRCPYCNEMAAFWDNEMIYGKSYWASHMCYYCKDCNAYVGTHLNTIVPLGTMANKELRSWRRKTHAVLDPIRQSWNISRSDLYAYLAKKFGKEIHVGESDINMCKKIIAFLEWCKKRSKNDY